MLKHLPNALTLLRLVLAPVVAWAVWEADSPPDAVVREWAIAAAILFAVAALTDLFDGMAARAFGAESKFGRIIDPIADKALVGLPLVALSCALYANDWPYWPLVAIPTSVIVGRDLLMTWLRLSAPDGEGLRVSQLAKWKTALELIVVGAGILLPLMPNVIVGNLDGDLAAHGLVWLLWLSLLVFAAALSAFTAAHYLAARKKS